MQKECLPQPHPQEVHIVKLVAEQAIPAMEHATQQSISAMLQTLPVPITITPQVRERDGRRFYTYQVGETTEEHPFGMHTGAQWQFLDAVRVSLEAAMQPKKGGD